MEELFTFPLELGSVKEEKKINVQVNWETSRFMDVVHVRGIYHITAKVRFSLEEQAHLSPGTLIEHIDLEGDEGYFEYAIPFNLELPNGELKELRVEDIKTTCQDSLHIAWQVICVHEEMTTTPALTPTPAPAQQEHYSEVPEVDVKKQIAEEIKAQAKIEQMVEQKVKETVKETVKQIVEPVAEPKVVPNKEQHTEVKKEAFIQPIKKVVEAFKEESSSDEFRNKYVNESINRVLEDRVDDSTGFMFQLKDEYRKQSVPLNKIRQE